MPSDAATPPDTSGLADAARVAALAATGLGPQADEALERFATLVRRLLDVPVALVSLVDVERQVFPAQQGLPEPWATTRETPLSHSFCQHAVTRGEPLVVTDAPEHPLVRDNLAIRDLGIIAYAGVPLTDRAGNVLGSLCAIDHEPRQWTSEELEILGDLAVACATELQLRIALQEARSAQEQALDTGRRAHAAGNRLALLFDVSRAMSSTLETGEALHRLARLVVPRLADWCVVDLFSEPDVVERVAVVDAHAEGEVSALGKPRRLPAVTEHSRTPLAQVLQSSQPVALRIGDLDASVDDDFDRTQAELLQSLGGDSGLVVGLRARDRALGALTLMRRSADSPFTDAENDLVQDIAARAGLALENARLYTLQRSAAETLQASMLTRLPRADGLQLAARYRPAVEGVDVGGDWYDAFVLPDGAMALVIADVVGHDLAAASKMGQLRNMLRGIAFDRQEPPSFVLRRLDAAIAGFRMDVLATCLLARLERNDNGRWVLHWSSAGHLPPLVLSPDGGTNLLSQAQDQLLLGMVPDTSRLDTTATLEPGDTVLFFTDGLVETRNTPLELGLGRLRRTAARHADLAPEQLCDALLGDMVGVTNDDDVALLAVHITGEDGD